MAGCAHPLRRAPGSLALSLRRRPQHRLRRARHLRRLYDERLLGELHRPRAGDRQTDAALSALLSRHVPDPDVRHEPRAHRQQHRPDVGRHRDRHPHHRADGRYLPHARGAGGGVEIFHPGQRRHRARLVRHHSRLHGGAAGARRGPGRHGVDGADREGRRLRARASQRCLRVSHAGLRHQGGAGAPARLASRCPCGRPYAHLRRALWPAPQRRALRAAALQDAARRQPRGHRARTADGDHGPRVANLRRLHALPPARHQAHVRLLLHRAHGAHHLRLRHGRARSPTSAGCCT